MIKEKFKTRKLLLVLASVLVLAFVFGVLFISILSDESKDLVVSSINNYFNGINDNKINYFKGLVSEFGSNLFLNLFIWLMGISIIGVIVIFLFLIIKGFLVGFSFCSVLYTYGFKGIFVSLIYILPEIIGLFILFVLSYYSINFSLLMFNHLFRKKEYNKKVVVTRYLKLLLFSSLAIFINSLIGVFVVPNILKAF